MKNIELPSSQSHESTGTPQQKFICDQTKDEAYERLKFHQRKLHTATISFNCRQCSFRRLILPARSSRLGQREAHRRAGIPTARKNRSHDRGLFPKFGHKVFPNEASEASRIVNGVDEAAFSNLSVTAKPIPALCDRYREAQPSNEDECRLSMQR